MTLTHKPQIAIITPNILTGIGLKSILEKMMPMAECTLFQNMDLLRKDDSGQFFHYFVSADVLITNADYFLERQRKTIVLVLNEETSCFPRFMHKLNVSQSENMMIKNLVQLAEVSHGTTPPKAVQEAKSNMGRPLTRRETEVLRLVVSGLINKEIAQELKVGLATVISHRKNITTKLNIKSVSGLTIYAVSHGIIQAEEI